MNFFSVLIPVHNRREMLRRALESVLRQTDKDFEVVVVDDGSTDDSGNVARKLIKPLGARGKVIRLRKNIGIPGARNKCVDAAAGRIAAFLDSDDVWHPRYLSVLRAAYDAVPDAMFSFTNYLSCGPQFSGPVRQFPPDHVDRDPIELMVSRPFIHTMSCFSAPLALIRDAGAFSENLQRFEDIDLYIRLLAGTSQNGKLAWKQLPFLVLPHFLVMKDIHLSGRSLSSLLMEWDISMQAFLDQVFTYPYLAKRTSLRAKCEISLKEGKLDFFHNFSNQYEKLQGPNL